MMRFRLALAGAALCAVLAGPGALRPALSDEINFSPVPKHRALSVTVASGPSAPAVGTAAAMDRADMDRVLAALKAHGLIKVRVLSDDRVARETMLQTLADRLDAAEPGLPDVWVLELSSFQLDGVLGFEPTAATVLNITQDHLDWHGSIEAYAAAKARIFGNKGLMVLNREDAQVMAMRPAPIKVPVVPRSTSSPLGSSR